jgi:hypothetical protein
MKCSQDKITPKFGTQRKPRANTLEQNSVLRTGAYKYQA